MAVTYIENKIIGTSSERDNLIVSTADLTEYFHTDNWIDSTDSQFKVSTLNKRLEFTDNPNNQGSLCSYDLQTLLGSAVSTTEWVLRFKFRFNYLAGTTAYYYEFCLGLSDSSTAIMNANQNFIGCRVLPDDGANLWRPRVCDGSSNPRSGSTANLTQKFMTDKDYFVEIKRTSSTNWSISLSTTNAYDGDLQDNSYTDASGATGLRYIKIGDAVTNTTTGAVLQGFIDNVQFYDDVTSATVETKPHLPASTIFIEVDTGKQYIFDGTDWNE